MWTISNQYPITCSTFSSQWTSTWARHRGRRSISASGSSLPYLVTREWYLRRLRAGFAVSLNNAHTTAVSVYRQGVQRTCKAALPQGSQSSNGWRTVLRLLSHCQSQHCHLTVILKEAWQEVHQFCIIATLLSENTKQPLYLHYFHWYHWWNSLCYHEAASLCIGVGLQ